MIKICFVFFFSIFFYTLLHAGPKIPMFVPGSPTLELEAKDPGACTRVTGVPHLAFVDPGLGARKSCTGIGFSVVAFVDARSMLELSLGIQVAFLGSGSIKAGLGIFVLVPGFLAARAQVTRTRAVYVYLGKFVLK